ncbi:MAG: PilT/PilU family type 4a pilus ATPase [Deltaproteobacteria bacterium]|nr:PilT/PilU family type 4a pilus ATPase [Deltaproteobacteria bacterium]
MSAQLEQLVAYLDRDGVTEIVISVGRPIAMKQRDAFVNLTARPLSHDQLLTILRGSPVASMVPARDGMADPADVDIGKRRVRVQVGRRGEEIVVRLERPKAESRAKTLTGAPRTKSSTKSPTPGRTKTPTSVPRTKTPTASARTKTPTGAQRSRPSSKAPPIVETVRAKSPSLAPAPRAKTPSAPPRPMAAKPAPEVSPYLDLGLEDIVPTKRGEPEKAPPKWSHDVDLGTLSGTSQDVPVLSGKSHDVPGGTPLTLNDLDLDPAADGGAFELDPADARGQQLQQARIDTDEARARAAAARLDATATWDSSVAVGSRATPLPTAAAAARQAVAMAAPPKLSTPVLADGPLSQLVQRARDRGASDLHVASGRAIAMRISGELVQIDPLPLSVERAEAMLLPLLDDTLRAQLDKLGYVDLAVPLASGGRLRTNITRHNAGIKGTFRLAMPAPSTLDELGLPKDLAKVVGHHQGLVVIAGPSGHGKTTTLAALVDTLNATKPYHILTVEDPIEIVYPRRVAVVSQREAGRHTKSFAAALKASLREDPDVIVIGELRDRETVEIALTASETGHLVLATMSTPSAAKTLDRLIDMFPPEEHPQVRASVAGALRAIVAQRLLPTKDGRVAAAIELLTGVLPLAVLIRDDKLFQLPNLMQRGKAFGMIRLDDSLLELVRAGQVDEEVAVRNADQPKELRAQLQRGRT